MTFLTTEALTCRFGGLIAVDSFDYSLKEGELAKDSPDLGRVQMLNVAIKRIKGK